MEASDKGVTPSEFKEAFADLILSWNRLESAARFLLEALAGLFGQEGHALSAHIPNKTLSNTIRALSEQFDEECVQHVTRFCDGFDILCSWRNYYVHGLQGVTGDRGNANGYINEIETKTGRLASVERLIARSEIVSVAQLALTYSGYASVIVGHVYEKRGKPLFAYQPLASTEKPPLPAKLARSRQYLLTSPNPLQSSRA